MSDAAAEPLFHFWNDEYVLRGESLKLAPLKYLISKEEPSPYFTLGAVKALTKLPGKRCMLIQWIPYFWMSI